MKQASNSFTKGLMLDIHPSAVQNTQLTDALNATIITYNGNEMMLQNDMGNTLVQDSKSGHIMGLSEGFVPVGLKEHGGIMYVVSANKDGVGEIGTIPSPVLKLELRKEEIDQTEMQVTTSAGPISTMVGITNFKVYPGEKFLPAFNLKNIIDTKVPSSFILQNIGSQTTKVNLEDRFISTITDGEGCSHNGLYELKLFSIYGSSATELSHVQKKQARPYLKKSDNLANNSFWFYQGRLDNTQVDIEKTWLNKGFHSYPGNLPPGRLAIKAELETIDSFDLPKINQNQTSKQQGTKAPYIYKQGENYILAFPGFEYKTKSIRFIGQLDITLTNQTTENIKDHKTIEKFSTVNISGDQYNHYQIQAPNQENYQKIEVSGKWQNDLKTYFTPLFEVNIGKDLDAWYRLEVKYKDIYQGDIDTFIYSFNPHHILNFDESYHGVEWKASSLKQQKAVIGSSQSSYSGGETVSFGDDDYYDTSSSWSSNFNGSSGFNSQRYEIGDDGYVIINSVDFKDSTPVDSAKSKPMKAVYTTYLYGNVNLEKGGDTLQDYQYSMITAIPTQYFQAENILLDNVPNGFSELNGDGNNYGSNFWREDYKANLTFQFNTEEPTIEYNLPIDTPLLADQLKFYVGQSFSEGDVFTHDIKLQYKFGAPVWKNDNGQWTYQPGTSTYYTDDEHELAANRVIFQYQVPNQSIYSLTPSFSLFGSTDEKSNIRLGLDRTGQVKEAWSLGENLYQTCMPDKNTNDQHLSSFETDTYYYNTTDLGSNLILDQGIYLITVDAGTFNEVGNFYSPDGETVNDLNTYGCNVDWNDNTNIDGNPSENPKIAVFIQNTPYQLARIDSMYKGARHRTFVPTLLYLPQQSIIRIEWKNIQKLQGIGLFRITRPVIFNDGTGFNSGDQIRLMYYQHPDLREIILPLEATYYEHVNCLDKEYDYYRGVSSLDAVNHHIIIDNIQFCKAPDRPGTVAYGSENIDPTYLWDASVGTNDEDGDGLQDFIYQYNPDSPQSTIIPAVGGNKNELVYRVLNTEL